MSVAALSVVSRRNTSLINRFTLLRPTAVGSTRLLTMMPSLERDPPDKREYSRKYSPFSPSLLLSARAKSARRKMRRVRGYRWFGRVKRPAAPCPWRAAL